MNDKQIYGGQAVIEGVMMRGKKYVACAVRDPHGNIVTTTEPLSPAIYASAWSKIPFLRAMTILWDTLVLGTRMLMYSANIAVEEEAKKNADAAPAASNAPRATNDPPQAISTGMALGTVLLALAFGIGLFFVLPLTLVHLADPYLTTSFASENVASFVSNILEGVIRLAIFLAYIYLIGLMPDVRRVFAYHGAEHKTIAADEAGVALVPEAIQQYGKAHARCGTGFLLIVVVVSIFVFALLGRPPLEWRIVSRIVLVPVVAALSYELIKFAAAHRSNPVLNYLVVKPSLALQALTTREPDAQMIEVAVVALQTVKAKERAA
ncbi:MAG: DUF1385 domain-containing protein [Chloroflexi bacterium]|nr:DUF1385 domain-containing protein [Chloroflexota bacterium]